MPTDAPDGSHAWHLFVLRLRLERLRIGRDQVMDQLRERGIGASVHFIPLHLHPYYRGRPETTPHDLSVATREFERVISLPLWPGMTASDLDRVVGAFCDILPPARR
jgi:dTDP-4-amino-4,6-dideoxygalactose transaminase